MGSSRPQKNTEGKASQLKETIMVTAGGRVPSTLMKGKKTKV